jgi:DeoR/GlpR family transcriptional regulator of sugar metabolism
VLSIAGADSEGYYNSNLLLVETEQAMLRAADQAIIVADSSKFGRASLSRLCSLGDVHTVVTDSELSKSWREAIERAGVQLVLAS